MSLTSYILEYTKDWNDPTDFPTYEADEAKVRADIQLLYDEMRDAFNRFVTDLDAEILPFTASEDIQADNVQDAIEVVQSQIASAVAGTIPDRSVAAVKLVQHTLTEDELGEGCVTETAIDDGAVTTQKIADNAIKNSKVSNGAVTTAKLADAAVETNKISNGAVTAAKLSDNAVETAKINTAAVTAAKLSDNAVETAKINNAAVTAAKLANAAVETAKISDEAVTAAKIADGAVSSVFFATVGTTWTGNEAPYTQTISVQGLLASDRPIIDVSLSSVQATAEEQLKAYGSIFRFVAGNGTLTAYADSVTETSVPIQLLCVRK